MEIDDFLDEEASAAELAACGLVIELLGAAGLLTMIAQLRLAEVDGTEADEEQAMTEITRRYMDLLVPKLAERGVKSCLAAGELIVLVREAVADDFQQESTDQARLN